MMNSIRLTKCLYELNAAQESKNLSNTIYWAGQVAKTAVKLSSDTLEEISSDIQHNG